MNLFKNHYQTINADGIVDFCCIADYSNGSILSNILQRQKDEFLDEELSI
jgi:hypothetical protein